MLSFLGRERSAYQPFSSRIWNPHCNFCLEDNGSSRFLVYTIQYVEYDEFRIEDDMPSAIKDTFKCLKSSIRQWCLNGVVIDVIIPPSSVDGGGNSARPAHYVGTTSQWSTIQCHLCASIQFTEPNLSEWQTIKSSNIELNFKNA